ncbi:MAG: hypothetical protein ACYTBS_04770 [Planctomycetota bacterium]|jgi:hypothetical protein
MSELKDQMIRLIQYKAEQDAAELAGEFARAASEDKEEMLAALEFEKWLAETCAVCLEKD